jgi:hypothetical protein
MRRSLVLAVGLFIALAALYFAYRYVSRPAPPTTAAAAAAPAPPPLTDAEVFASMQRATAYLKSKLAGDHWEPLGRTAPSEDDTIALTATAYRALTTTHRSTDDPDLAPNAPLLTPVGVYLIKAKPGDLHTLALHALALLQMSPRTPGRKEALNADAQRMAAPPGPMPVPFARDDAQLVTHTFAAMSDSGVEIPVALWRDLDRQWRLAQNPNGTWTAAGAPTDRTLANLAPGITSLFHTIYMLDGPLPLSPKPDKSFDTARTALDSAPLDNIVPSPAFNAITLLGPLAGIRYTPQGDLLQRIGRSLLTRQQPDGSIPTLGISDVESTSLALLFLAANRVPVAISKLQYRDEHWNARPRDVANLVAWLSRTVERPLQWQTVTLDDPLDRWMPAPILLITGSTDPHFTDADVAKLRAYIAAGGTIFSTADGGKKEFTDAIQRIASGPPGSGYEMRMLPPTHALFSRELWASIKNPPPVMAVTNGLREQWIHVPSDLGASWQQRKFATTEAFNFPANLWLYVNGKAAPRPALRSLMPPTASTTPKLQLTLARITYFGNADPEPGAWPRLAAQLRAEGVADLNILTVKIADLDARKHPLAHLTGTAPPPLGQQDIAHLVDYVNAGGTLFIESAGGSPGGLSVAGRQLAAVVGNAEPHPLDRRSPLYISPDPAGYQIDNPTTRRYTVLAHGARIPGKFLVIERNNRPAILFSELDLTSGLLGTDTWGIDGYAPETSRQLATNLLLWLARSK